MSEAAIPGSPNAATTRPAVPVVVPNSRATCVKDRRHHDIRVDRAEREEAERAEERPPLRPGHFTRANSWMKRPNARM